MLFQSPRSGKFESNQDFAHLTDEQKETAKFQSPRSGKFESNGAKMNNVLARSLTFQSPRSGKFESNHNKYTVILSRK